jgi:hypothetical protein
MIKRFEEVMNSVKMFNVQTLITVSGYAIRLFKINTAIAEEDIWT